MSQITTHVLDTATGKPAAGIKVSLQRQEENWKEIGASVTNTDGRIMDILKKDLLLEPGIYKMRFETQEYFDKQRVTTFYPFVEIIFTISTHEHYHIPLLISPYGFSTYRGS